MLVPSKTVLENVFWSAPLERDADFTAEDPLALDYLAQQVGLWLFRGFTTRTNRAQNYAVVLYGLYLVDKAIKDNPFSVDDSVRVRLFERWERFWALAVLEYRKGTLDRGDIDAMRGVRGAKRAWFSGQDPLPLDFPLISRQSELGSLGSYLTSLREYHLVSPGSLRITHLAKEIIDSFWSEVHERDWNGLYEKYALESLDLASSTIARSRGRLTLSGLGERSRLSSLVQRKRKEQQDRLWNALFAGARDGSTLPLSERLITAFKCGVDEPEDLLVGLLEGNWGDLSDENRGKIEVALAFGRLARILLGRFNRAYGYVDENGWVADTAVVAHQTFPGNETSELLAACTSLLSAQDIWRFRELEYHGREFLELVLKLTVSGPLESLEHLLSFHQSVQKSRRRGGGWLREEREKLVIQVAGYNGYKTEAAFPSLKLGVVRQLLADLGRLE